MYVIWNWPQASTFYFFFCSVDEKALNRASWYEYLGVVLDASLTWNVHVEYLILISWRSCRGAQHVLLCVWGAAKKC